MEWKRILLGIQPSIMNVIKEDFVGLRVWFDWIGPPTQFSLSENGFQSCKIES